MEANLHSPVKLPTTMELDMEPDEESDFFVNFTSATQYIGSTPSAIMRILNREMETTKMTLLVLFINVNPKFIETTPSKMLPKSARISYNHKTRQMIVKLTGPAHGEVTGGISAEVIRRVTLMSEILSEDLYPMNHGRIRGNAISKEPDWSVRPYTLPLGHHRVWPSIVLETGVSENMNELMKDARWWLSNSKGLVNMVLVVTVDQKIPHITFRCVVITNTFARHTGITRYVCSTRHEMEQTRDANGSVVTTNGPLVFHIDELFLRTPIAPETDIIFSAQVMDRLASEVWKTLGI
ncbi:hypothetical protein N7495_004963 [Penicillium taxi]|uniref:uncharacterized protein n=1 Tax=Penicillium taxi TaxID=168475 RepID=UPI002545462A|nr:uncharacterized protein N7495_004963 [Penicillium taxi]KAJ5893272.1 hypothetical protein N7495_004963 [Penicillium taxi]